MEWSEAAVDTPMHSNCGRSGHHGSEKRARIIALQNEIVTKNLTSTTTLTSTAASTSTFSVTVRSLIFREVLEIIGNCFLAGQLYHQWLHIRSSLVHRRCQWKMRVLEERMLLNLNLVIVFM